VAKRFMTKVKICGITNLEDALLSAKFGADALGFNFYKKSPRYILPEVAREITRELPENVLKVGVFVNEDLDKIIEIAKAANLDAIQLHGEEMPEFASELKAKTGRSIIKAFRVSEDFKPEDVLQYEVDAILLDAYSPREHGGTGETFDWDIAKKVKEIFPKLYLAGGLVLENVDYASDRVHPVYIDVCSGVESKKRIKDKIRLINFIKIAKADLNKNSFNNIYEMCWMTHPNLAGFRLRFDELSHLQISIDGFVSGIIYGAKSETEMILDTFFSKFYKNRICKITGITDDELSENQICFQDFVSRKYINSNDHTNWDEMIIESIGSDGLEALYTFYAFLEEYRIDFDSDLNE
jgi:phosphoribosylanthranilate isomerase